MEIRLVDIAQGLSTPLEVGTGDISRPGWVADGRSLFVSVGPRGVGSSRVLRFATDRRSAPDTIMPGGLDRYAASRNGRVVALQISTTRSPNRYLGAERDAKLYASRDNGPFEELSSLRGMGVPSLSPDGNWMTYERYGSGPSQIFLERFPLDGHPLRVPGEGYEAFFSAKGDKLFYRVGSGIMQVALTIAGDQVTFGTPKPWVTFNFADFMGRSYKLGNDDRVLAKLLPSTTPRSEIRVTTGGRW